MNPATGAFISMDAYQGSVYDPVTLLKYLYANANPVMFSDPSGNFAIGLAVAAIGQAVMFPARAMHDSSVLTIGLEIVASALTIVTVATVALLITDWIADYQINNVAHDTNYANAINDIVIDDAIGDNSVVQASDVTNSSSSSAASVAGGSGTATPPSPNDPNNHNNNKHNRSDKINLKKMDEKSINEALRKNGFKNVHEFKEEIVGRSNISKFNVVKNVNNGDIYLVPVQGGTPIPTDYNVYGIII